MSQRCARFDLLPMISGTIVRDWGRNCSITLPYVRYGGFMERNMLPLVTDYANFVCYPKGDSVLTNGHTGSKVTDTVISNDGIDLFSCSADGFITHWNMPYCLLFHRWKAHSKSKVTCLAHGSSFLASGSEDGTIKLWDTNTHILKRVYKKKKPKPIKYLEFTEMGDTLLSYDGSWMRQFTVDRFRCVFKTRTLKEYRYLPIYKNNKVSMISDSGAVFDWDLTPQIADNRDNEVDKHIIMDRNKVDLNCDGSMFAYLLRTHMVVMRWPELELVSTIRGTFNSLRFHPLNPHWIAVSGIRMFDVRNGKQLAYLFAAPHGDHSQLRFTPDGSKIIAVLPGSDDIRVYQADKKAVLTVAVV